MREKIFEEIRRKRIPKGGVWRIQEYNSFLVDKTSKERQDFRGCMHTLCEEGLFIMEMAPEPMYRLTEKGESVIYAP